MVSRSIRTFLQTIGRKGGKRRAKRLSATRRAAQARRAALLRWMRQRFGTDTFEALSLPGWEIVDAGLRDLADGNTSPLCALAVGELSPRLRLLGVPIPGVANYSSNLRESLYRTMEAEHGMMAHERFSAWLQRLDSFCDTLAATIATPRHTPHRYRRWCT